MGVKGAASAEQTLRLVMPEERDVAGINDDASKQDPMTLCIAPSLAPRQSKTEERAFPRTSRIRQCLPPPKLSIHRLSGRR
jgi:hypothetical protein